MSPSSASNLQSDAASPSATYIKAIDHAVEPEAKESESESSPSPSSSESEGEDEPDITNFVRQGKVFDRVKAIELDEECLNRWGEAVYDLLHGPNTHAQLSPERYRKEIVDRRLSAAYRMTYRTYCTFPNIPRLERNVLLIRRPGTLVWLFVLKDNSSKEAIHAPLDPEDVEAVKKFLGVKEQKVKWRAVKRGQLVVGRWD
ncbi:hypothetical protein L227DRAFT_613845 [Lentinus tigrinus ALCF2SS1-6]|uniref:Uncharacterized protein n=2 Tax=Lentinus tigrinus TaxID=5365 RepID=A0A5C2S7C8_9APHY|nr:hypothetical protein L227DRAFT_613845 [Lentinus tigrinus ALCF2SS1-6]